jgi:hypothetical protein
VKTLIEFQYGPRVVGHNQPLPVEVRGIKCIALFWIKENPRRVGGKKGFLDPAE